MPPSAPVGGSYVFDRFRLSADGTLLVRDDTVVPLAPKVLQTLLVLVQRQGEVVRKEDLLRAVWPDSFVEDTGLTRNISLLRRALGDNGQRLIVNVPRVGYRFTAPVERAAVSGAHAFGSGHSTARTVGIRGWPRAGACDAPRRARARPRRPRRASWRSPVNLVSERRPSWKHFCRKRGGSAASDGDVAPSGWPEPNRTSLFSKRSMS